MSSAPALIKNERAPAILEVCSVRVADKWFGVPITHILEIVGAARPQPVPLAPAYVGGLVHYRGDVLTTVSLRQLLGLPPTESLRTSSSWRPRADASDSSSTLSAKCSPFQRPTTSQTRPSSTNAASPCSPEHTNSRTSCSSCSTPNRLTPSALVSPADRCRSVVHRTFASSGI